MPIISLARSRQSRMSRWNTHLLSILLVSSCCLQTCYAQIPRGRTAEGPSITYQDIRRYVHKKMALVIGVEYQGHNYLEYTDNDAAAMENALRDFGYEVTTLVGRQATTKESILRGLDSLIQRNTDSNDQVIVFFSGHGERASGNPNVGFLIPSDGDGAELFRTCIEMTTLQNLSRTLRAKQVLFLIDACYSGIIGGFTPMMLYEPTDTPSCKTIGEFFQVRARQVITAGRSDEQALMDSDRRMSIFTYYVQKALTENRYHVITARELHSSLEKQIRKYTEVQHPGYYEYLEAPGQFVLAADSTKCEKQGGIITPDTVCTDQNTTIVKQWIDSLHYDLDNVRGTLGSIVTDLGNDEKAMRCLLKVMDETSKQSGFSFKAALLLSVSYTAMDRLDVRSGTLRFLIDNVDKLDYYQSRILSINIMEQFNAIEAEDKLLQMVQYDNYYVVRERAIKALGRVGRNFDKIGPVLLGALNYDDNSSVRSAAIDVIRQLKLSSTIHNLVILLSSTTTGETIRRSIIQTLGDFRTREAVEPLLRLLEVPDLPSYISSDIVDALIKIDDERALGPLRSLSERLPDELRWLRDKILQYLRSRGNP